MTPRWATRAFLRKLKSEGYTLGRMLDPCAGELDIAKVGRKYFPKVFVNDIDPIPKTKGVLRIGRKDFLRMDPPKKRISWIVSNPPYSHAIEFIEHGMKFAHRSAWLLRLNFLGSQKRAAFQEEYSPDLYILPKRPSFTRDGKTDATEYAWFVYPGNGTWEILHGR